MVGEIIMKIVYITVTLIFIATLATFVFAGWENSIETNFVGTSYTWTNDTDRMMWINAVLVSHDSAVSNNITLYRLDADGNAYSVGTTGVDATLLSAVFTASGNGQISVPNDEALQIIQTATNKVNVVIDLEEPR
jgi:hypothetical protein